jgi:hypothetical protein
VFSPPFSSLYTFSDDPRDISNNADDAVFWEHFRFVIAELRRTIMPGRLVSIHCMQLPTSKQRDGFIGLRDFRGDIIRAFQEVGFYYHSEVMIRKDPVTAMQRSKAIGLLHKQVAKDSSLSRMAVADYVVTMRCPGDNPEPVKGRLSVYYGDDARDEEHDDEVRTRLDQSLERYYGDEDHSASIRAGFDRSRGRSWDDHKSISVWQKYAEPIWLDIAQSDVLSHRLAREVEDERHISPLQLTVIRRCMQLWTNPGDVVFSPFAGIGSAGYVAMELGRKFIGVELKESYYKQAVDNIRTAERERLTGTLFG